MKLENQELKKKLDEALEACRISQVHAREIELEKSRLEEILIIKRLGEDQFLISMEQQMRQRREWNRKCSELQSLGVEPLTKKRKLEGEYIEDIKDEIKDDISETMQKESDKSVKDTSDESVYDDDNNPSDEIEVNYDNYNYNNSAVDLTDAMEVNDNITPHDQKEQKQFEEQDSIEKLKAEEKITELTLESNNSLRKEKEELSAGILYSIKNKLKEYSTKVQSTTAAEKVDSPETAEDSIITQLRGLKNKVIQKKQLVKNLEKNIFKDATEIARLSDELAAAEKIIDELNISYEDSNNTVEDYENHLKTIFEYYKNHHKTTTGHYRIQLKILKLKLKFP